MPLSECISALRTGQSLRNNPMSDPPSSFPSADLVEIHWDGGQILMQDQQARHRKTSASISPLSFGQQGKDQPRDVDATKLDRFGPPIRCSVAKDEFSVAGISAQQEPEDDLATWLNYTIDDYDLEFLSESTSSGANTNSIAADKSGDHSVLPKASAAGSDHGRTQMGQQWVGLFPGAKSSNTPPTTVQNPPTWEFQDSKLQREEVPICPPKLPPASSRSGSGGLVNFSHFARPVSRLNPNLQNVDRLKSNEKASTTAPSSRSLEPPSGAPTSIISQEQLPPVAGTGKGELKETATTHQGFASVDLEDGSSNDNKKSRNPSATSTTNLPGSSHDLEKSSDLIPMVASSSLCTGNISDPKHKFKRKTQEGGSAAAAAAAESGYQTDDADDDDSTVAKKTAIGRGGGGSNAKRTRASEVHNLSERRRRDRINEKMRALQELIPNCNKADKASMLDEAIEYLKTLQFQVQIMSMSGGGGLCMPLPPPMMVPPGMQNLVPHQQMAHFSPMGLGMGMGMGFGMLDMHASPMFPTNCGGFPMFGTQCHPSMPMFAPVPTPLARMNSTPQVSSGLNDRKIHSGSEKGGRKLEEEDDEDEELLMHNGSSDPGGDAGTTN